MTDDGLIAVDCLAAALLTQMMISSLNVGATILKQHNESASPEGFM